MAETDSSNHHFAATADVEQSERRASMTISNDELRAQMSFIVELDKLKNVLRMSRIVDKSRRENSAEHSWHLAIMALALVNHANEPIDLLKVVSMVLIHDVVEIESGDVFLYQDAVRKSNAGSEAAAAVRIFGLLPEAARRQFLDLWQEFERRSTPEARFAAALDRLQPIILAMETEALAWRQNKLTAGDVIKRNQHIAEGSTSLWQYTQELIQRAVTAGYLLP